MTPANPSAATYRRAAAAESSAPTSRVMRYLSALLVVSAAFWAYSLLVAPLIEPPPQPPPVPPIPGDAANITDLSHIDLRRHFPVGAWQLNAKVVDTKHGALVFGDDVHEGNRIVLSPVTLIFVADGDGQRLGRRPIIMDAPEGVELITEEGEGEDQSPLDFGSPISGRLLGEVRIHRAASPGKKDGLQIVTRNIQIDERRIATPYEVRFAMGPHYGFGRDLEILLADDREQELADLTEAGDAPPDPAEKEEQKKKEKPDDGKADKRMPIESIELVKLDKLVVCLDAEQSAKLGRSQGPGSVANPRPLPTPVEITCQGPLKLDMKSRTATIEDQIRIARVASDGPPDELTCDHLVMHFDQSQRDPLTAQTVQSDRLTPVALGERKPKFEIHKVVASGKQVRFVSPSTGAEASGEQLAYDLASRMVSLVGRQGVSLTHEGRRVTAARIDYQLHAHDPKRLGQLWAAGPGTIQGEFGERQKMTLNASWKKLLRVHPERQQHVVSLTEQVRLQFGELGGFNCDQLHLYLNETLQAATPRQPRPKRSLAPDRLVAKGHVDVQSSQLTVRTPELQAWFQPTVSQPEVVQPGTPRRQPLGLGNPLQASKSKLVVDGRLVQLNLRYDARMTMSLDVLQVQGQVSVNRRPAADQRGAFQLRGDSLRIQGAEPGAMNLQLAGQPARIDADGGFIEGGQVTIDQPSNQVTAEGPGGMQVSPTIERGGVARPGSPVRVAWNGGMTFDGSKLTLHGGVRMAGEQGLENGERMVFDGSGRQLEVTLDRGVDLSDIEGLDKMKIEPRAVRLAGDVRFEGRTMGPRGQTSYDRLSVGEVNYNPQTGVVHAAGPGWVSSVRSDLKMPAAQAGAAPTSRPQGGAPRPAGGLLSGQDGLHYLRVEFQQQIDGNAQLRDLKFSNRVRCVYALVERWDEVVEEATRRGNRGGELTCQTLRIGQVRHDRAKGMVLEAQGNIYIQSQHFDAHAARLTYDQLKDLMVLHGDPRGGAALRYAPQPGFDPVPLSADLIKFWPQKMEAKIDGFRGLSIGR